LFHLVFESHDGTAFGADSEEKHEPASDVDTVVVDSLKALDPKRPIREALDPKRPIREAEVKSGFWQSVTTGRSGLMMPPGA
jgi:hypothetical protein